jgi:spore coat protein CotH
VSRHSRHLAWRRNWWLFALLAVFTAGMLALVGTDLVVPYTTSPGLAAQTRRRTAARKLAAIPVRNVQNPVDVFDTRVVHRVQIAVAPADYAGMVSDYRDQKLKTYRPATVTIDGVSVPRVGVRLKGNSSLIGLRNDPATARFIPPLDPAKPQELPLLLKFDEYVPKQLYQGVREVAVRTAGTGDVSFMPELVTNRLIEATGDPALRTSYSGVSFNGSPESAKLLVEVPDKVWVKRAFPTRTGGLLYKAVTGAKFSYVGDDPAEYSLVFEQKTKHTSHDLGPAIKFLKFVDTASDARFEAHIADRVDIGNIMRYLALHNMLSDPDSLAGTGNNYYLYYDLGTRKVAFVAWDTNLSLGHLGFASGATYRPYYEDGSGLGAIAKLIPVDLNDLVPGAGLGERNILQERLFESPKYKALYDRTYRALYRQLLASGKADRMIDTYAATFRRANAGRGFVDAARYDASVTSTHKFLRDRMAFLDTVAPVARDVPTPATITPAPTTPAPSTPGP